MGPLSTVASPVQEIRRVLISKTSSGKALTNFIAGTVKSNISILARTPALTPRSLLATGLRTESPTAGGLLNTSSTFVKNPTIIRRSPALLAASGIHSPTVPTSSAVHTVSVSLMSTVWIRFAVRDTGVGISEEDQVCTHYI